MVEPDPVYPDNISVTMVVMRVTGTVSRYSLDADAVYFCCLSFGQDGGRNTQFAFRRFVKAGYIRADD